MSTRDGHPAGVPCWVETLQPDPRAALSFYGPLFGWTFSDPKPMPGDLPGELFVARLRGRDVAGIGTLPDLGRPAVPGWSTSIAVDDVDAAVARATAAGGRLILGPLDGGRIAALLDPAGAPFVVESGLGGAQVVNEVGCWMMSSLHTPDPAGASAFYGALFGWETEPMAPGAPVSLFRLPGHVGGEPGQLIPRDVVALLTGDGGGTVPPHWNVNFRVADVDATVAHAAELGATVLIAPFDTPGFRNAVLADPQGAAFSISHLT